VAGKKAMTRCHVLWSVAESVPDDASLILSFLNPMDEHELSQQLYSCDLISMAKVMDGVKDKAYEHYLEIVADIGMFPLSDGRSLRSHMHGSGKVSQWWYHPVAFRNSESDPTYTHLLAVLAIAKVANERGVKVLNLHQPPHGVAEVLQSCFTVVAHGSVRSGSWAGTVRRVLGRIRYSLRVVQEKRACDKIRKKATPGCFDVALQGFWDWSVLPDPKDSGRFVDKYFGALPAQLEAHGKKVGYWCWYDPWTGATEQPRSHHEVLAPVCGRQDIVLLQSLLRYRDILSAFMDARAIVNVLRAVRDKSFRALFKAGKLDLFPLFRTALIEGSVGMAIVQCQLFERATARASEQTQSRLLITFLEHFPQSRAMYAALQGSETRVWNVQHGCYNQGKTYGALHPTKEFAIQADGESVPHVDRICVMGELGAKVFGGCGYDASQVLATGSCRYDHVKVTASGDLKDVVSGLRAGSKLRILVATSVPAHSDFALVQAAVAAIHPLADQVSLRLRTHPFGRMDSLAEFASVAGSFELSRGDLAGDIVWADLVLISQSTVGEEALLAGKDVWQFRFPNPDQSSLAEVVRIPRFYSVTELRQGIEQLLFGEVQTPKPSPQQVYRALFQVGDELPSKAIANKVCLEFR